MRITDLIEAKKRGNEFDSEQIRFFVEGYVSGVIPDYQVSALLMAIWFSGMSRSETTILTQTMAASGDQVDLGELDGFPVDKHSTGGVADTTSLIVAPIVAACGGCIAKMSGRGLGHTGGTLDKLESIPGMRVDLSSSEFVRIINTHGLSIVGQTGNLVPADKKLYSLRDVTGTVDSIPLIASSIMSKKLASGASGIVLDVKCGTGAFMKDPAPAATLAETMVDIGNRAGRKVIALVTDMNQPLGTAIGNALDVAEAIRVLRGEQTGDLIDVSLALSSELLQVSGIAISSEDALHMSHRALESGSALEKLRAMIAAQHGDPRVTDDIGLLPTAQEIISIRSPSSGYIASLNAALIGSAAQVLGAGRLQKDDVIDPAVGIEVSFRLGDEIDTGDGLFRIHVNDRANLADASAFCLDALSIEATPPSPVELIYRRTDEGD